MTRFEPFDDAGDVDPNLRLSTRYGNCWIGSLASTRPDAWRCMSGNYIDEPCFSSADADFVVCVMFLETAQGCALREGHESAVYGCPSRGRLQIHPQDGLVAMRAARWLEATAQPEEFCAVLTGHIAELELGMPCCA